MVQTHHSDCPAEIITCSFCSVELPRSTLIEHNTSCPDVVIPCTHANNGCLWTGPRHTLSGSHIPSCPYESIKGFFAVNSSRMSTLADENTILKCKVEALEGIMQTMRHDLHAARTALGPWYRPDGSYPPLSRQTTSEPPFFSRASPTSTGSLSTPLASSFIPFGGSNASNSATSNALAPYFPPQDENFPWLERRPHHNGNPPSTDAHGRSYHESMLHTSVAPINLSTTLEGSLDSLRESVVTLSASVDSLARRHDIELRNEALRTNEEISRLNYTMNGLRMQVS